MVTALILSGGTGVRLGGTTPKQYLPVGGKPVLLYSLQTFQRTDGVDQILIVASEQWQGAVSEWVAKERITKFAGFAPAGKSRQHSILSGLQVMKRQGAGDGDAVIIHDAARPRVTSALISACLRALEGADGVMPVLPVKDTIYQSGTGARIDALLDRDSLFAGQAPECFRFGPYYAIHQGLTDAALCAIRGSSEIAYRNHLNIRLIPGEEGNYKITTALDLEKFRAETECGQQEA
jgi:2-C-methyl-D-erythritol 4-phosphate cytidylyltransferase